jgi:tellurite resistance protein
MAVQSLPREVFILLAAVARADGKLDASEIDAIARAAIDEGLSLEQVESIEKAIRDEVAIDDVETRQLSSRDRLYAYAVASWVSLVDGARTEREDAALFSLAYVLQLTARGRMEADEIVKELYARPDGSKLARFDLSGLRQELDRRLIKASMRPPSMPTPDGGAGENEP